MRVLLTGATGFIGAYVLDELLARGDVVRVLIRPETLARSDRAQALAQRDNVEIVAGTLMDEAALIEATANVEVVYHLAWQWHSKHGPDLVVECAGRNRQRRSRRTQRQRHRILAERVRDESRAAHRVHEFGCSVRPAGADLSPAGD